MDYQVAVATALATLHGRGQDHPAGDVVAREAGLGYRSKTFRMTQKMMETQGLIAAVHPRTLSLTEAGYALLPAPTPAPASAPIPTNAEYQDTLKSDLTKPLSKEIFEVLADGGWHTQDDIAQYLGVAIDHVFLNALVHLNRFVHQNGTNYRLKDECFPYEQ